MMKKKFYLCTQNSETLIKEIYENDERKNLFGRRTITRFASLPKFWKSMRRSLPKDSCADAQNLHRKADNKQEIIGNEIR